MEVFWHRRDLRIPDNVGLAAAAREGEVVPVFVVREDVLDRLGERQRAFVADGVRALDRAYRDRGSGLLVRVGEPARQLAAVRQEYGADAIRYNRHYRPARRNAERRVDRRLPTKPETDHVLVAPDRLDAEYPTHSQFYDDWTAEPKPAPVPPPDEDALVEPDGDGVAGLDGGSTDRSGDADIPRPAVDVDLPRPGYGAARDRYDAFLADGIDSYADTRDDVAAAVERPVGPVSRLSPYLAAGMIGTREVWADATERYRAADGETRRNVEKYRYELSWRERNYHLLAHNPGLLTHNYRDFPNEIVWRNDREEFEAWKRGETGYPFVDAGMAQLDAEGYVHNRPRQVVASFLTKHLLVDWRKGARYFADRLVDHDPATNYGNWQWIASTGTDPVDVRVFDPVAQLAKYDEDAEYVRAYLPELGDVPPEKIVDWPTLDDAEREALAPEYAHPVVDRDAAYERAVRVFEEALGKR
ncbi:MAG: deoxyribodipyrimidine photo-lyase [Haloarculaceae archaeon]